MKSGCVHWLPRIRSGVLAVLMVAAPFAAFSQGSPDIIWQQQTNISDRVNAVIFTLDGNTVISGGSDRLINFWNSGDGTLLRTFNSSAAPIHESAIEALALSPDGARLASVSYQTVKLWRLSDGSSQSLSGHRDWVVGAAFSQNGSWLATASFDGTVRIWRGSDGTALKTIPHPDQVRTVAFSPDSSLLASGGGDSVVHIWRTSDWIETLSLKGHTKDIDTLAFSPDGSLLASGSYDGTVRIWRVSDGSLRNVIANNNGTIYSLSFNIDGSMLAYTDGEGNTVRLVRTSDGAVVRTYDSNVNAVQTLAFSPSGLLAYGRVDRTVVLARVQGSSGGGGNAPPSITLLAPPDGHTYFSPANIPIAAQAGSGAGVAQVEFSANSQSIAVITNAPFSFQWPGVGNGTYTISAVVTDRNGQTASDSVTVNVSDPPPETVRPKVSITSPPANSRILTNPVTMTGKASDNVGVAQVLVALNSGDFALADGTTSWSINLQLIPGINTVQVKSVDTSGNESLVSTRKFTYVVTSPLNVTISGDGKVSPSYSNRLMEVGKPYTIKAVPAATSIFNGWSGGVTTNSPNLTFTMTDGLNLEASFVPNPFLPVTGVYRGLALSDPPDRDGTGYGQITVTRSGSFTGRLIFGTSSYPLSGRFLGDGSFSGSIPRGRGLEPFGISLQLPIANDSGQITGVISNTSVSSVLTADLATFNSRTNPAPQAGRYTFVLPGSTDGSGAPQGTSYGTVTISSAGVVTVGGKLADNVSISQSTTLSKNGTWPFFQWIGNGKEILAGQVTVGGDTNASGMNGTIQWFRNPSSSGLFGGGFATQAPFNGFSYVPAAKGTLVLDVGTGTGNTTVVLSEGNLDTPLSFSATLGTNDKLVSEPVSPKNVSASFTRSTGQFSGSFLNPSTSKQTPFNGVILQNQNVGTGFFIGTDQSGTVQVQPATPAP